VLIIASIFIFDINHLVSHSKIRTEKICLNCGTETPGRYCPNCGQENIEPKQSVWHLIHHFFSDITHFDGKFFITVKDLFAKPGFLSREYMSGRRASYLDPIRMYIFTSAIFFLIFFSLFNVKNIDFRDHDKIVKNADLNELLAEAKTKQDSLKIQKVFDLTKNKLVKIAKDSGRSGGDFDVYLDTSVYHSFAAYDSAQRALPSGRRDGWFKRIITRRKIELAKRYRDEHENLIRDLISENLHNLPKVLFISLPLFALMLKLLYIRRKQFFYVDHGIFSIHLYIFSFLILLIFFGLNKLHSSTEWGLINWLIFAVVIYPFFYYYKAMRRFYGQRRAKTILKYILLFFLSLFVYLMVFVGGLLLTVFEA
jgi:Protein of unknown function (DUF3667)